MLQQAKTSRLVTQLVEKLVRAPRATAPCVHLD